MIDDRGADPYLLMTTRIAGAVHALAKASLASAARHLPRRQPVNTSAIICPQHRKARILAQMQEGDARRTRR
jgi:hypothetical protein